MRRTIMRYVNLSFVLTFAMVSPCVKKRFPTPKHLVDAGELINLNTSLCSWENSLNYLVPCPVDINSCREFYCIHTLLLLSYPNSYHLCVFKHVLPLSPTRLTWCLNCCRINKLVFNNKYKSYF